MVSKKIWFFIIGVIIFSFGNLFLSNYFLPFSNNNSNVNDLLYMNKQDIKNNSIGYFYIYEKCYGKDKLNKIKDKIEKNDNYNYDYLFNENYSCNSKLYETFPYIYKGKNIFYINTKNISNSILYTFGDNTKDIIIILFYIFLNFQLFFINTILLIITILFVIGFIYYVYYIINLKNDEDYKEKTEDKNKEEIDNIIDEKKK